MQFNKTKQEEYKDLSNKRLQLLKDYKTFLI